jgi:hypothetical protein
MLSARARCRKRSHRKGTTPGTGAGLVRPASLCLLPWASPFESDVDQQVGRSKRAATFQPRNTVLELSVRVFLLPSPSFLLCRSAQCSIDIPALGQLRRTSHARGRPPSAAHLAESRRQFSRRSASRSARNGSAQVAELTEPGAYGENVSHRVAARDAGNPQAIAGRSKGGGRAPFGDPAAPNPRALLNRQRGLGLSSPLGVVRPRRTSVRLRAPPWGNEIRVVLDGGSIELWD